eukprot:123556-Pelagomonas_calceolata.AAC.3
MRSAGDGFGWDQRLSLGHLMLRRRCCREQRARVDNTLCSCGEYGDERQQLTKHSVLAKGGNTLMTLNAAMVLSGTNLATPPGQGPHAGTDLLANQRL